MRLASFNDKLTRLKILLGAHGQTSLTLNVRAQRLIFAVTPNPNPDPFA